MPDMLTIAQWVPLAEDAPTDIFQVEFVRFATAGDVAWFLRGMSFREMPDWCVLDHGIVRAPDGAPRDPDQLLTSHRVPQSEAEALDVARAALANPDSEIRQKGFAPDTPIYRWHNGKPGVLLSEE